MTNLLVCLVNPNKMKISATKITMYNTCPYKYWLNYELGAMVAPQPHFIIGTMYHKAVEKYHQFGKLDKANIKPVLDQIKPLIIIKKTSEEIDRFGLVRLMLEKYAEYPVDDAKTIDTEWFFNIDIPCTTIQLNGFIDRVVEGGMVEYKTTSFDFTEKDVHTIQADIYSYASEIGLENCPILLFR